MSRDLLHDSTQALRALGDAPTDADSATRQRILRDLQGRRRRRVERRLVFIPAAAVLLIATAAAAATGSLSNAWHWARHAAGVAEPAPATVMLSPVTPPHRRIAAVAPAPPPAPAAEPETPPEPEAPPTRSEPRASAPVQQNQTVEAAAVVAAAPAAEDPSAGADALYRTAHQLHFGARDCGRAIPAWERYLKEAPNGRFALEARYNRGLCLVRRGNTGAAVAALRPFATGRFGGYRQSEAQRLLDALGAPENSAITDSKEQ
jgi:TolA-binding protein